MIRVAKSLNGTDDLSQRKNSFRQCRRKHYAKLETQATEVCPRPTGLARSGGLRANPHSFMCGPFFDQAVFAPELIDGACPSLC